MTPPHTATTTMRKPITSFGREENHATEMMTTLSSRVTIKQRRKIEALTTGPTIGMISSKAVIGSKI